VTDDFQKVKLGSIELPISRFGVYALSAVLVLGASGYGLWWLNAHLESDKIRISPAERLELSLAAKHFGEEPTRRHVAYDDERGALKLMEFNDGSAVAIRRIGHGPQQSKWFPDPSEATPAPAFAFDPDLSLADPAFAGGGGCLRWCGPWPHPYPTDAWWQARDECWIEVFQPFADGCLVSWMRNTCAGFDAYDADGPILCWRQCNHQ
jgi:hypothetical protein